MKDKKQYWEDWNSGVVPNYPHAKVVQYCLRNYPSEVRGRTRVLDLGCGSGVDAAFLAAEGFAVTGVDFSQAGIERTRKRVENAGRSAELLVESVDALSFPDASFDLVICVGVFDPAGLEVARGAVRETARVLRPGGKGLFVFASDVHYRIIGDNVADLHGYSRAEVEELYGQGFTHVWIDRYITTFGGGQMAANDWLVTLEK